MSLPSLLPTSPSPLPFPLPPAPVVVTAIDPSARLATQLRAFAAWRELGCPVLSAVAGEGRDLLDAAGLGDDELIAVPAADTVADPSGRPLPRIVPLLSRAAEKFPGRALLLVNPDVFPAMRGTGALALFAAAGPLVALTREDCALLEDVSGERAPYRAAPDAVLIRPAAVAVLQKRLAAISVARRMAFGLPGWELLLAALARTPVIGGRVMDGALLLHERHAEPIAAAAAAELAHYVGALRLLGATRDTTAAGAARDVTAAIRRECELADRFTTFVRRVFYAAPAREPASDTALKIAGALAEVSPTVRWNVRFSTLTALADRVLAGTDGRERIDAALLGRSGADNRFAELLAATAFELACRAVRRPLRFRRGDDAWPDDRLALAAAFRVRLLDEGVLDPAALERLGAAGAGDEEQAVFSRIKTLVGA